MNVAELRVTKNSLQRCINDAARSSSNVVFVPPLEKNSMGQMMTYQQAMMCLRDGKIVGNPVQNEHGHWEADMQRYAANHLFSLRVVAECNGPRVVRIYAFPEVESI